MSGTRLDIMQTVKLQVDGVIHNIALSSTAAAKLIGGDPDTVNAVISAIKLTKENPENNADSSETLTETSSEFVGETSQCLTNSATESLDPAPSEYLVEQLEYLIPQTSEQLGQPTTAETVGPVAETQACSTAVCLPVNSLEQTSDNASRLLMCSSVSSLLDDDSCSDEEDFKWTDSAVVSFLEHYKLMAHRFNNGREKKIHLWQELASVMQRLGYAVTGPQLDWKWKSLRSRFRKARDGRTPMESFIYYEAMKDLFTLEEMANALPPVLQQSMMGGDGTSGGIMIWSEEATKHLISQYKMREERFRDGIEKKKVLWNEIAAVLKSFGITCTGEQAEGKWKSLLRAFRKAKTLGLQKKAFPFFAEMSEIEEDMENSGIDYSFEGQEQVTAEVQWTDEAVDVLLEQYTRRKQRFHGEEKKKAIWLEITEALNLAGFAFSLEQVVGKWKTLVRAFRKAQSSEQSRTRFGFYDKMYELIGDQNTEVTEHELTEQDVQTVWSDDAVKFFLVECQKLQENGSFSPGISLWTEIAGIMARSGYHYTTEEIQRKWCSLCEQFFNSSTQSKTFEYHDLMKNLVTGSKLTKQELLHEESPSSCAAERMWTDIALKIFLSECQSRKNQLACERKRELWAEISEALRANGYGFTNEQVENKWKSLYRRYKKAKLSKQTAERFPYFDVMEELTQFIDHDESHGADDVDLWTDEAVQVYLTLLKEKRPLHERINREIWEDVSMSLQDKGFKFNVEQIQQKWKMLIKEFRRTVSLKYPKEKFAYFNEIKELLQKDDIDESEDFPYAVWSHKATEIFLKACCARKMKLAEERKHDLWEGICEELCMNGFSLTSVQVENKWKSLYRQYKKAKLTEKLNKHFPYFDQMRELAEVFEKRTEHLAVDDQWTSDAIEILITEYQKRKNKYGVETSKRLWTQVTAVLRIKGFDFNSEQVQYRWEMLLSMYKKACQSVKPQEYFAFYDLMKDALAVERDNDAESGSKKQLVQDGESPLAEGGLNCHQCGEWKKSFDNHPEGCLICLGCTECKTCSFCAEWPQTTWKMVTQQHTAKIKQSPSTEHLTHEISHPWTADAMQLLLHQCKLQKDKFQSDSADLAWPEIVKTMESKGYSFTKEQLENKWRELNCDMENNQTLSTEHKTASVDKLQEDVSYNRRLSSRLRAKPKRKYPWDDMLDSSVVHDSVSGGVRKNAATKLNTSKRNFPSGCSALSSAAELKLFLKDFVQKQIEVEERSFKRLKTVHENKMKSLHELLSSLEDK